MDKQLEAAQRVAEALGGTILEGPAPEGSPLYLSNEVEAWFLRGWITSEQADQIFAVLMGLGG